MILLITRTRAEELGFDFDVLLDDGDFYEDTIIEHRKDSEFYKCSIVEINETKFPDVPRELDGFWKTDTYLHTYEIGFDPWSVQMLIRVEQVEETRVVKVWKEAE